MELIFGRPTKELTLFVLVLKNTVSFALLITTSIYKSLEYVRQIIEHARRNK